MPVIKEYGELTGLNRDEWRDLKDFALALDNQTDQQGNHRSVLVLKNDRLQAQNYVGIIETRKRETRNAMQTLGSSPKKIEFFLKM